MVAKTIIHSDVQFGGEITSSSDKNIELNSVAQPSNANADGGGITLKGTSDKTFNWLNATQAWTSSEHLSLGAGKSVILTGATSGTVSLTAPTEAGTTSITLPSSTGTLALLTSTVSAAINLSGGTAGSVPYQSAQNTTSFISPGQQGQVLTSSGTSAPTWATIQAGAAAGAFWENDITLSTSYTITTNKNAITGGPITIANGVVITVPTGSTWIIV